MKYRKTRRKRKKRMTKKTYRFWRQPLPAIQRQTPPPH